MEDYSPNPQISHMPFIFQNNAKCTYFHPRKVLEGAKMYLVNNVLENQSRAVPLLMIATRILKMEEEYLPISLISFMLFFFENNAKCTYFHPKMFLRGLKMYLVNNVLENQI